MKIYKGVFSFFFSLHTSSSPLGQTALSGNPSLTHMGEKMMDDLFPISSEEEFKINHLIINTINLILYMTIISYTMFFKCDYIIWLYEVLYGT